MHKKFDDITFKKNMQLHFHTEVTVKRMQLHMMSCTEKIFRNVQV